MSSMCSLSHKRSSTSSDSDSDSREGKEIRVWDNGRDKGVRRRNRARTKTERSWQEETRQGRERVRQEDGGKG
jgi:hypothetical protein